MKDALAVFAVVLAAAGLFVLFLPWVLKPIFRLILLPRYGFRVTGRENLPARGPVVVVANHVTWIDGFFLAAIFPRRARALVNADFLANPILRWLAVRAGIIPVPFAGPKAQRAAIQASRASIDRGEAFVIFPEGQLTRTGFLGPFYRGLELILKGKPDVPVVPVYLDNLWGSVWGFSRRRKPSGLRRVIGVHFGPAVTGPIELFHYRQALVEAAVPPVARRLGKPDEIETIDESLPHFRHPKYGLLTASTPDWDKNGVVQRGSREGTVGLPLPGVAIRAVDETGRPLPAETVGRLQGHVAGLSDHWVGLGHRGSVDHDGFVRVI